MGVASADRRQSSSGRLKEESDGGAILMVLPGPPQPTDNMLLVCAQGRRVLTNSDLLCMMSPTLLFDAIDMARAGPAEVLQGTSSPSGSTSGATTAHRSTAASARAGSKRSKLLQLPVPEDSAEDWLLVLRLVHPGMRPKDRPQMDWATAGRILKHADKYQMVGVIAQSADVLVSHLRRGTSPTTSVPALMDTLSTAMRLGLQELRDACSDVIATRLRGLEGHAGSSQSDAGSAFSRQLRDWLDATSQSVGAPDGSGSAEVCSQVASVLLTLYEGAAAAKQLPPTPVYSSRERALQADALGLYSGTSSRHSLLRSLKREF